jgi:hypothetical protein
MAAAFVALMPRNAIARVVDSPGYWSLERLGYGSQANASTERRVFRYSLPANAVQGGKTWYLLRLHYRLEFEPRTGAGVVQVTGLTNGYTAVLVEYEVKRKASGHRIDWKTTDLVTGRRHGRLRSGAIHMRATNFLQTRGVRAGGNRLTIEIEALGHARVRGLTLYLDSGIRVGDRSPPTLLLRVASPDKEVHSGDRLKLPVTIENAGGYAAEQVKLRAVSDGKVTSVVGPDRWRIGRVDRIASRTAVVRAVRSGRGTIALHAAGASNTSPSVVGTIDVRPSGRSIWETVARTAIVFAVFIPALLVMLVPWERLRRGKERP